MERESVLYKTRRKCQAMASYVIPDELMSKLYSRIILKKDVDLKNPKTFNEKIQWLKINVFPNDELVIKCADKYAVREYIVQKGLEDKLVPLIGYWRNESDIDWSLLPEQFVLKCNHGCAYNIVCEDKSSLNKDKTKQTLRKWLKDDFGVYNIERHYSKIEPHIITCEVYLGKKIIDYKFFCFNGQPRYIYISSDLIHDRQAQIGFYNIDGTKMPLIRDDYAPMDIDKLPSFYNDMLSDATLLCKDFPFVRVDFFVANNKYYFAELTFTPSAGMMPFNPDEYDGKWGEELDISEFVGGVLIISFLYVIMYYISNILLWNNKEYELVV